MLDLTSLIGYLVLGVIGWIVYKVHIFPYYISPLRKIPGPPSDNPFFGNLKSTYLEEAGEAQFRWVKKYGNVIKYHGLLNKPIVLVTDTKLIQDITINHSYDFTKPPSGNADLLVGKGLSRVEGEIHKRQRKMMIPAFSHGNIKEMVPTMTRVTLAAKDLIEDKLNVGETKIEITPYVSKTTLDILGLIGFNYEFNSLTTPSELAEIYYTMFNSPSTILRIVLNVLSNYFPSCRKIPLGPNKLFNKTVEISDRISKELVKEKYRKAKDGELKEKDILSVLINTNQTLPIEEQMTFDEIRYQIMTFLIAGHETVNISTCWALHLLSQNPHDQDLLREELVKAFPDKSKFNPTLDEINSLEYLNCVVKETLRLNNPVISASRNNAKDETFNGYFIPKNSTIMIDTSVVHRLPSIWGPTANDFDPKRWLDPKDSAKSNYLPFLNGPRSCIGNKLALVEFKVVLSVLIRNFVFRPVEGLHIRRKSFPVCKPDPRLELMVSRVEA